MESRRVMSLKDYEAKYGCNFETFDKSYEKTASEAISIIRVNSSGAFPAPKTSETGFAGWLKRLFADKKDYCEIV
ncbi:MAG: hypothetical protein HZC51_01540 [Nitrospirae bacterium]|nr:hypothetical protein [Nitrospirota bacterium]